MQLAELIPAYIKVIIWPGVVISALVIFKNDIKRILSRIKKLTLPGGTELDVIEKYVELESNETQFSKAEKEKEELLIEIINKLQIEQNEKEELIQKLEKQNERLKEAYSKTNQIAISEMLKPEEARILKECLNEFSNETKEFMNYWFENPHRNTKEAADHFDTSVNQIWTKKHRLIKKLNECYSQKKAQL